MKRRNVESNKYRKQFHFRKCKFTEGMYGNAFLYLKFLLIWCLIMIADFLIEFRFEFLWPFWLFTRSIYDSFKYQGLIFSLFFALIAFLSDLFCYMFIPVQWLFFASSTYVWVQYVWHTERGVCLPTILLWLLFVYIEAAVRFKTVKTIDLCRPFAAHCIGYPMVTLGFGFKSYLSFKWRLRKQRDVKKVNNTYMQLLLSALPLELQQQLQKLNDEEKYMKTLQSVDDDLSNEQAGVVGASTTSSQSLIQNLKEKCLLITHNNNNQNGSTSKSNGQTPTAALTITYPDDEDLPYIQQKQESVKTSKATAHQNGNHLATTTIGLANLFNTNAITCDFVQNTNDSQSQQQAQSQQQQQQQQVQSLVSSKSNKNKSSNHNFSSSQSATSNPYQSNTSKSTPALCSSSINASHTNININMTINTTAIATATAQNTTSSPASLLPPPLLSQPIVTQTNGKKYKNKDKQQQQQQQQSNQDGSTSQQANFISFSQSNTTTTTAIAAATATTATTNGNSKEEYSILQRLEEDVKKLQQELQQQKNVEQYLRNQINYLTKCDRTEKTKLEKLQQENESLQNRLQKYNLQKQKDKDELQAADKRLQEEKRLRMSAEAQLVNEKKSRETQEKMFTAASNVKTIECGEYCKQKTKDYEIEAKMLTEQLIEKQDRLRSLEMEIKNLLKYRDSQNSLVSALNIMEEKNSSLQDSLSCEKRFKMDLVSALGETKRQLEAALIQLDNREKELNLLKLRFKASSVASAASTMNDPYTTQNDLLAQLLSTISNNQQFNVNNYNNSTTGSSIAPSITPNGMMNSNNNANNNNNNMNGSGSGSHCSTPHQLDPNIPLFTPNV